MIAQITKSNVIRFGVFQLDLRSGELHRGGLKIKLQHQPFQILALLLEHPGVMVTREEIRAMLWPTDTFVDFEHSLSTAIRKVRNALGDTADNPIFIETVPKHGYRFITPVEIPNSAKPGSPTDVFSAVPGLPGFPVAQYLAAVSGKRSRLTASAFILFIALLSAIAWSNFHGHALTRADAPHIRSLAVLPLQNLSRDPEQDFFADGITEELTTELGKISALRVISRASVTQYKGSNKPLRQIARELNVDALIEGTVLRSGNHVRVTANLIQASPEGHLWADTYDTEVRDILTVQRHVADSVAREVRVALAPRESASSGGRPVNTQAQDLYFRGIHAKRSAAAEGSKNAVDYLQKAVRVDPNYARAYAGLALAYAVWYPQDPRPRVSMPKAREAALKALALDESLAGAHTALAYVKLNYDWDWAGAEKEFKRALELDPNSALARDFYARELVALGRTDEALAQAKQALELEPYSGLDYPGWIFYLARRSDDSLQLAQQIVSMDPNFSWGRWLLAANYEQRGKPKESAQEYLRFEILSGAEPQRIRQLQEGFARSGAKGYWQANLQGYVRTARSRYAPPVLAAGACVRLGNKACAFEWLEKGFQERDDLMIDLNVDPVFDEIRSDSHFQDLLRRVGLQDTDAK